MGAELSTSIPEEVKKRGQRVTGANIAIRTLVYARLPDTGAARILVGVACALIGLLGGIVSLCLRLCKPFLLILLERCCHCTV